MLPFARSLLALAALLAATDCAVVRRRCNSAGFGDGIALTNGERKLSQKIIFAPDTKEKRIYFRNACSDPTKHVGVEINACNERQDGPMPNITFSSHNRDRESVDVVCDEYACPDGVYTEVFDLCYVKHIVDDN